MKIYKETSKKSYHELMDEQEDKKGFKRSDLPRTNKREVVVKDDEPMISMAKSEAYNKRPFEDRKPYDPSKPRDFKKPYPPREGQEGRKPYTPKEGQESRKPYAPREGQEGRKPFTPREGQDFRKPYTPKEGQEGRKPYTPREGQSQNRPYQKPYDKKPFVKKNEDR